jgi:hypothetical protein
VIFQAFLTIAWQWLAISGNPKKRGFRGIVAGIEILEVPSFTGIPSRSARPNDGTASS